MLSSEYIHEKFLDTTSCSSEDVRKLAELMELYPYVSSFPILYLKALANSKDVRLESEIEKYAYRISSRAVLFDLLNPRFEAEILTEKQTETQTESQPEVKEEIVEVIENPISETIEVKEEIIPEIQEEIIEAVENTILETIEVQEETIPETQEEIIEAVENPISETIEVEDETITETQEEIIEAVENPISETIAIEEEINAEIQEEKSEEIRKEDDQLEQLIQAAAISSSFLETNFHEEQNKDELELEIEKTIDSELDEEKKIEKITTIEKTEIETNNTRSFSSWLSLGAKTTVDKPIKTKPIEEEVKEPEIKVEPKKTEYYNFEKPKKEFYSPVKKAKESLSEDNMPVSETLAKIFALQGNYPKSIYVYEQLILIFPEKKSFFATQIKNLKKKLNS